MCETRISLKFGAANSDIAEASSYHEQLTSMILYQCSVVSL